MTKAKMVIVKKFTEQLLKNIKKREIKKGKREVTFAGKFYKNPVRKQISRRLMIYLIRSSALK